MLYIGEEMTKRGHEVVYMATQTAIQFAKGFNIPTVPLKIPPDVRSLKFFASNMVDKDVLISNGHSDEEIKKMEDEMIETRKRMTGHMSVIDSLSAVINLLSANEPYELAVFGLLDAFERRKPDLVICDYMIFACMDVCAHLNISYVITVRTMALMGHPDFPNYIPDPIIGRSFFSITLWERLYDKFILGPQFLLRLRPVFQHMNTIRTKYGLKTYYNPETNIVNCHILLTNFFGWDIPYLMSPFIHTVGPIVGRIELGKTIPNDLFHWLEEAKELNESVVYVAFGSIAIPSRDQIQIFLDGFSMSSSCDLHARKQEPHLRVLWSLSGISITDFPMESTKKLEGLNVRFEQWVPQLNVLTHAAVKLFLTHGGMESVHESLYAGKPSLIVPFFGDQQSNALLSRDRGVADFLDKNTMTSIDVCKKVHKLLTDYDNTSSELYRNLYKMSRIVHHNLNNYKHIYKVLEMEMDIGSQHLIPPSVSWLVAHNVDLWVIFLAIIWIVIYVTRFVCKRLCCKRDKKEKLN
ncbi:unnamed protein product [Rotaria magnacalcarata]|uniref:UDP-glucuronosyltransferase n=1 Tax=Rotaria magnacalcarata TaxID=392030 RepID=A0A820KEI5_9BILA|nr:unnamed protein product [Rotaria magnacalcarata]CAF2140692.1 unnamed protein product [Rotaria magnacalcarata]CAF4341496.1 unnamed protein product [Rotaria magnacalcarata]CAF4617469.1 unnamed protein product [Rotaria magnacalcarata]